MRSRMFARRGECVAELLEDRRLLSVTVTQTGDLLDIKGDTQANHVKVFDSQSGSIDRMVVSVDANGNGSFTDPGDINNAIYPQVRNLVARLGVGADSLEITAADPLLGATRNYDVRLGGGADVFRFTNPVGNDIRDSAVTLTVDSAGGNDDVSVALNRIVNSQFNGSIGTSWGDDSVRIYGGDDIANSTVAMNISLGDGNDTLQTQLDWEGFDLIGPTSLWSVTAVGGMGNDTMNVIGSMGNSAADVYGTLAFNFQGEDGWDQINYSMDRFTLRGGTLSLRANGGLNGDTVAFTGTIGTVGGGMVDVALRGNVGMDHLLVNVLADPSLSYAAPGGAIVDGGTGVDTAVVQGTLPVVLLNTEA